MNTARDDRARYQRGAVGRATPARNCRGCGTPIQFIKSPTTGKVQACDCEERILVTAAGNVVRGYPSHWSTCTNPPQRTGAAPSTETAPVREAPRKAAAAPPAPARTDAQLALLGGNGDPRLAAAYALADATVQGHYDQAVRSSIVSAMLHPKHELDVHIASVTGREPDPGKALGTYHRDRSRYDSLRKLEVKGKLVFQALSQTELRSDGNTRHGMHATLRLQAQIAARFLGTADTEPKSREPGEEG